jgi:hypothetical protein
MTKKSKFEKHSCEIKNEAECEEELEEDDAGVKEEENEYYEEEDADTGY